MNNFAKIFFLVLYAFIPPLVIWGLTGNLVLNGLLEMGIPNEFHQILSLGLGQFIYCLLWNLLHINKYKSLWNYGRLEDYGNSSGIYVILFVIIVIVGITSGENGPTFQERMFPTNKIVGNEVIRAAAVACKGLPVPGAADYTGHNQLNSLVLLTDSGERHQLTSKIFETWKAYTVQDIQLVACVGEITKEVVEVCNYTPSGEFTRYQGFVTIDIVAAKTGELVERLNVEGDYPYACPSTMSTTYSDTTGDVDIITAIKYFYLDY